MAKLHISGVAPQLGGNVDIRQLDSLIPPALDEAVIARHEENDPMAWKRSPQQVLLLEQLDDVRIA
jgi:hypothetical protein